MNGRRAADRMYQVLVNQAPGIRERYQKKREKLRGIRKAEAWIYLLFLNIGYHILRMRHLGQMGKYPYYEYKPLYIKDSESSLSKRESPQEFAERLLQYDVISFDVFDTLLFRPFSEPADLFFLVGERLGYMDFKRLRMEMEWKAREKKHRNTGHHEVTLEEIYSLLAVETGIDKETGMRAEEEMEERYCFANPYMLPVLEKLRQHGKRLIIISDMYLGGQKIRELLKNCGCGEFDAYYVSCDADMSKGRGNLYGYVRQREETSRKFSFAHVGDNEISDRKNAQRCGFDAFYYPNVNQAGNQYRSEDMSVITGSFYRGMVNAHIHNGLTRYSREYEYGYIYGGLFVTGYCQFIHRYVNRHQTDRILFFARDGDVLMKAYRLLYPSEAEKCRYVYWSRLAAAKMAAGYFKYDYFRRFLIHKVNQGRTLKDILDSMELEDMLPKLCGECGYTPDTKLTDGNADRIKEYLEKHWNLVMDHYREQLEAGKSYFSEILSGCESVVSVDIGWAGSGAVALDYIVNQIWKMDCEMTGIIAGTNTCHNAEPDFSETFLQSGKLVSYLYSQRENRDIWKFHDAGKDHNLYWEMLLDAPHGSLKGFYLNDDGTWRCEFKEPAADTKKVEEVQRGILDYVKGHIRHVGRDEKMGRIWGRDAYAPMVMLENEKNVLYLRKIYGLVDEMNIG